jgi:hypothetical protein
VAWIRSQKLRVILGLLATLALLLLISYRPLVLVLLALAWSLLFAPLTAGELVAFAVAGVFFLVQNYVCLKSGLFEFRDKDLLLMPYYEPLMWGFYFLSMKRFVCGRGQENVAIDWKSISGAIVTSIVFSLFSFDSRALLIGTACSTALLFLFFHTRLDLYYALYALTLGVIIELFGVSTGLWSYPAPDFLGIPYWFATMWISVGLLGRRLLIPASEWLGARIAGQRA